LLVLDGARHFRERKLLLPPFHGHRVHVSGRIMQQIPRRVSDTWPLGSPFPVHRELQAITLDVILRAVFGIDEGEELARLRACLLRLLALANGSAAAFLFIPALRIDLGRFSPWGRFVRDRRDFAAILLAAIARRRREGTARRTPVATNVLRVLKAPARIGGLDLPAGVGVSASIYLTHHRPDLWPDPERFAPERFIGARPNPYAFLPFGGGDRRCLGAAFAT